MRYYIYSLKFLTPVHFGNTADGGTLENVALSFSSDSLFSALCNETAIAPEFLQSFIMAVKEGTIRLSSLFPFYNREDTTGQWEYYVPRPIRMEARPVVLRSFQETKQEATRRKAMKKVTYVRASFLAGEKEAHAEDEMMDLPEFGAFGTTEKLNRRVDPGLPYFVSTYSFSPQAGLYFIVAFDESSDALEEPFDELVEQLGYSGIGGERSSGCGKFELADDKEELYAGECIYDDTEAIMTMLTAETADYYMNVASLVPAAEEVASMAEGTYKLRKRSGFVSSPQLTNFIKRNSYYSVVEGSCFTRPLSGKMLEFAVPGLPHPVYRNGRGLFMGVCHE